MQAVCCEMEHNLVIYGLMPSAAHVCPREYIPVLKREREDGKEEMNLSITEKGGEKYIYMNNILM